MSLATKFVSFDRLKRYTQHVKSYVGQQILNAKGEWAKQLNLKVDKVEGKGLSTNDFTTELKNKLNGIEAGAQVNTVTGIKGNSESAYRKGDVNLTPANIGAVASSNGDASNTKVTFTQSTSRVNLTNGDTLKTAFGKLSKWFADLKAVAFSGSYNDLSNKPTTLKNPKSLTIQQNGGNQTEYDGSTALTVNITKAGIGLDNVENKSSATIRSELTSSNVTTALGYAPINSSATNLTEQNLDGYKGTDYMGKMYYAPGNNSVTGKPSGVDNFWMWVTRNGHGVFSQILMDNKCQLYIRYHNAISWSTWKQVISSGNNISLLNNDKDYQTLQQVEDKINEIVSSGIGQVTTFSFQVVEELPSSGTSNHIYLVPISGSTESDNYYEEYCYINSKWELIGTTKVDLTAYAKKTDIPTALKNPNAMTLQINGTSQGTYDGSAAKTYNVSKESLGLDNVENKSSATIREELTLANVQNALGFDFDSTQAVSMCTHSKSGTVHTLVTKDGNTRYSIVRFVATADFTAGDTFRLGFSASTTVVTPKLENGDPLPTGAFKKNSVCIACTGDTSATINTLFFKGGGGLPSDVDLAAADAEPANVLTGKTFYAGDEEKKTGTMTNRGAVSASLAAGASYTVPAGYHNGSGVVSAQSLSSQTQASAASGDIVSGKTAYVNGNKVTGSLAERPALTKPVSVSNDGTGIYIQIPTGAYRTLQSTGYPEVQLLQEDAINNLPGGKRQFGNAEYISLWTDQNGSAGPSGKKYIQSNHIPVGYYASNGEDYSPQVNAPAELFGNATADRVMKNATFTSVNGACISGNLVAGFIDPVMYAQQYNPSYQSVINIVDIQVTRVTLSLAYQDDRFVGDIIIQVNVTAQLNGGYTTENGQITIRNFEVFPDVLS